MHRRTIAKTVLSAMMVIAAPLPAQDKGRHGPSIEWTLKKTGAPLEREAVLVVKDAVGKPVVGAQIEVNLNMPSMPDAHRMPAVRAQPTSTPGSYVARFTLEMAGEWSARIEMKSPQRLKVTRKFRAD